MVNNTINEIPERRDVPQKDTWDLSLLYKNSKDFKADLAVLDSYVVLINTTARGAVFTAPLGAIMASVRLFVHSVPAFAFSSKRPISDN